MIEKDKWMKHIDKLGESLGALSREVYMEGYLHGYRDGLAKKRPAVTPTEEYAMTLRKVGDAINTNMKTGVPVTGDVAELRRLLGDAIRVHKHNLGLTEREARIPVVGAVRDAFAEEWGFYPDLTVPRGRLSQGQVLWLIGYVKEQWEVK